MQNQKLFQRRIINGMGCVREVGHAGNILSSEKLVQSSFAFPFAFPNYGNSPSANNCLEFNYIKYASEPLARLVCDSADNGYQLWCFMIEKYNLWAHKSRANNARAFRENLIAKCFFVSFYSTLFEFLMANDVYVWIVRGSEKCQRKFYWLAPSP